MIDKKKKMDIFLQ